MKRWESLFSVFVLMVFFVAGVAEGAGTLKLTFKYKDSTGVEQPLPYAYVHLRARASGAPVEKFFSPAAFILGPTDKNGSVTASVPEGDYYIRVTRRNPLGLGPRPLGPPENGDYTWNQAKIITISANTTTDLGTQYAWLFGSAPVTISGTVTNYLGAPMAGRIIKATIVPCVQADYSSTDSSQWVYPNNCGPEKHIALQRTDANGNYTLFLRNPGTYYIYESTCLGGHGSQYQPNSNPCVGTGTGPITVNMGEQKVVNFTGYR